jgi:3-hydroxyisobutyrate dehydrogenase-like beta-hydroxyacid dehydrogenase
MNVGVVGLGPMGSAMARRLSHAGHRVTVYNRTVLRAEPLVAEGAVQAPTPVRAADNEVVITMLADDAAVMALVSGKDGVIEGLPHGAVHLTMSTMSVALADQLTDLHRAKGQLHVSAPVLGRPPAAEAGELFVMAAGEPAEIARVQPLLDAIGQRVFIIGPRPSQANLLKLCANFLIYSTIEQLAEVFALTEKGGIDRGTVYQMLTESFFNAPVHKNYGKLILERNFDPPGAKVGLGAKDIRLVLQAGEGLSVPLPFASVVRDRFLASIAQGESDLDFTVISRGAAKDAGLEQ